MRLPVSLVLMLITVAAPVAAQTLLTPPPTPIQINLSGPRVGITTLTDSALESVRERYPDVPSVITQFGWQFEKQFYSTNSGAAVLNEWVVLLGGLDRNMVLPSISWMVGARTANGTEFGVGPNLTAAGWSLAFAAGTTLRTGFLNVPINVAVVPSRNGMRVSFLTGFSMRTP